MLQLQRWQMWGQFEKKIWALICQPLGLARGLYQRHTNDKCSSQEAWHAGATHGFSKAAAAPFWGVLIDISSAFRSVLSTPRITPELSQTVWAAIRTPVSVRQTPAVNRRHACCSPTSVLWGILAELRCHLVAVYGCGLRLRTDAHASLAAERVCPALAAAAVVISQIRRCAGSVNSSSNSSNSVPSFPWLRLTGSV